MTTVQISSPAVTTATNDGLLRFITAGSVDDGKSTLIGRLLFDSKSIFADQLDAISRARHKRTAGETIDLSLLTDGLEAEREQGITIDVAYRYFATPKRKFIIADTPGHEQYTRNMVTGASTADAAIILVDISKITIAADGTPELLTQTKRHSTIARLLNIPHVIVAINKMDLVDYDKALYDKVIAAYARFATQIGLTSIHAIPLSALAGDNVVHKSDKLAWYEGPTLITLLESLPVSQANNDAPLRFPVQLVARHNGHEVNDFRGYMGRIASGVVRKGDAIVVEPAGTQSTVKEVLDFNGPIAQGIAGQSVTILLTDHVDISRGDMISLASQPSTVTKTLEADLCWLSEEPLDIRRKYLLKQTSKQVNARITDIHFRLNINTQEKETATSLQLNDIAQVTISLQQPLAVDSYADNRTTGSFILIDTVTHATVAGGMIRLPA